MTCHVQYYTVKGNAIKKKKKRCYFKEALLKKERKKALNCQLVLQSCKNRACPEHLYRIDMGAVITQN